MLKFLWVLCNPSLLYVMPSVVLITGETYLCTTAAIEECFAKVGQRGWQPGTLETLFSWGKTYSSAASGYQGPTASRSNSTGGSQGFFFVNESCLLDFLFQELPGALENSWLMRGNASQRNGSWFLFFPAITAGQRKKLPRDSLLTSLPIKHQLAFYCLLQFSGMKRRYGVVLRGGLWMPGRKRTAIERKCNWGWPKGSLDIFASVNAAVLWLWVRLCA